MRSRSPLRSIVRPVTSTAMRSPCASSISLSQVASPRWRTTSATDARLSGVRKSMNCLPLSCSGGRPSMSQATGLMSVMTPSS